MQIDQVIQQLVSLGVTLEVDGESLWATPKAALTYDARELIKSHKPELINAIRSGEDVRILAQAFYNHLFGEAKQSNCCYARAGRYCKEGERLRKAYYQAARNEQTHFH
ncbi:MAG: hypothetical protein AB2689_19695 [Candidatus Thiodiazotropha taylori]